MPGSCDECKREWWNHRPNSRDGSTGLAAAVETRAVRFSISSGSEGEGHWWRLTSSYVHIRKGRIWHQWWWEQPDLASAAGRWWGKKVGGDTGWQSQLQWMAAVDVEASGLGYLILGRAEWVSSLSPFSPSSFVCRPPKQGQLIGTA